MAGDYAFTPSDRVAGTVEEFLTVCIEERGIASDHLVCGYFGPWLRDQGREDLAREADKAARSGGKNPHGALDRFLKSTRPVAKASTSTRATKGAGSTTKSAAASRGSSRSASGASARKAASASSTKSGSAAPASSGKSRGAGAASKSSAASTGRKARASASASRNGRSTAASKPRAAAAGGRKSS